MQLADETAIEAREGWNEMIAVTPAFPLDDGSGAGPPIRPAAGRKESIS